MSHWLWKRNFHGCFARLYFRCCWAVLNYIPPSTKLWRSVYRKEQVKNDSLFVDKRETQEASEIWEYLSKRENSLKSLDAVIRNKSELTALRRKLDKEHRKANSLLEHARVQLR